MVPASRIKCHHVCPVTLMRGTGLLLVSSALPGWHSFALCPPPLLLCCCGFVLFSPLSYSAVSPLLSLLLPLLSSCLSLLSPLSSLFSPLFSSCVSLLSPLFSSCVSPPSLVSSPAMSLFPLSFPAVSLSPLSSCVSLSLTRCALCSHGSPDLQSSSIAMVTPPLW